MKVTITGATGFIGSHLIDRLLGEGHSIVALVRNPAAASDLQRRGVQIVRGDVTNVETVRQAVVGSDVVFNLARARAHAGESPGEITAVNVGGARNVALECRRAGVSRMVHASSTAVYGSSPGALRVGEKAPLHPDSTYAKSKMLGEAAIRASFDNAVLARITAVLGPRCMMWLPLFKSAKAGTLRLAGRGDNFHHPADVADVVDGLVRCAFAENAAGRTYNIAGPEPVQIARMVEMMAVATGSTKASPHGVPKVFTSTYVALSRVTESLLGMPLPKTESVLFLSANRSFDISLAAAEIGYVPQVSVRATIERTADFYRSEGFI